MPITSICQLSQQIHQITVYILARSAAPKQHKEPELCANLSSNKWTPLQFRYLRINDKLWKLGYPHFLDSLSYPPLADIITHLIQYRWPFPKESYLPLWSALEHFWAPESILSCQGCVYVKGKWSIGDAYRWTRHTFWAFALDWVWGQALQPRIRGLQWLLGERPPITHFRWKGTWHYEKLGKIIFGLLNIQATARARTCWAARREKHRHK